MADKHLFTGYFEKTQYEQEASWRYPYVLSPQKNTVVRSYREGATKRKGFKDEVFQKIIEKYFSQVFQVDGNIRLNIDNETRPFEPDIVIIDNNSGLNIRIDVEIDEPRIQEYQEKPFI